MTGWHLHSIVATGNDAEHHHYDVRFVLDDRERTFRIYVGA